MLLISQTMATYDEMPFRAICQRNLRNEIREGGSKKRKRRLWQKEREVNVKGTTVYGQLETMCAANEGLFVSFTATMME